MDNEKLSIAIPADYNGKTIQIDLREGTAPDINNPVAYEVQSNISLRSIVEYVSKKHWDDEDPKNNKGLIIYSIDPDNAYINFVADPNDSLAMSMKAKLLTNQDFADFKINKEAQFSQEALEKFVLAHAHCFENVDVANDLRLRLRNFEARFEQVCIKEDNRQGEKNDSVKTAIKMAKGEMPETLKLKMPLYKHQQPIEFDVSVEIDKLQNNRPGFSFYSLDIEILKREQVADLILTQIDLLKDKFPCLEA